MRLGHFLRCIGLFLIRRLSMSYGSRWVWQLIKGSMMTSSNGNIFRFTGHLWGESIRLWGGTLMFSLICAWTNGWTNNRHAGDLRDHGVHYDVTLMKQPAKIYNFTRALTWISFITIRSTSAWGRKVEKNAYSWRICTQALLLENVIHVFSVLS